MPEVVVVGGGATGVGVARDLALRGVDVTLVERDGIAAGTSGRMHGLLHSGARYAVSDPASARECRREGRVLRSIAPHCVTETGGLFVSLPSDPDHVDRLRRACADAGVETGARIRTGAEVADLRTEGGRVSGVALAGGERLAADHVVNAAGPWAGGLASAAGVDLSVTPSRGVMVVLDGPAVGRVLNRCRPRSEGDVLVPVDGHPVAGTTDRPVDDPDDYPREAAEVTAVRESLSAVVPELRAASVVESYWGVRPLYGATDDATEASRGFAVRTERGLTSVVGGKLTTHRLMAAVAADEVCERLGVDADATTAERPLPADETALRAAARRWAGRSPVPGAPAGD
ncbi:glycerol-3-phosphate dehydrogenase [Halobacteriales archaeon SW_7_71_33]|nr:MAG: glycerol-3-phosphate dehydrogenase [Halobacteriales archaeon SW_7_71_33]